MVSWKSNWDLFKQLVGQEKENTHSEDKLFKQASDNLYKTDQLKFKETEKWCSVGIMYYLVDKLYTIQFLYTHTCMHESSVIQVGSYPMWLIDRSSVIQGLHLIEDHTAYSDNVGRNKNTMYNNQNVIQLRGEFHSLTFCTISFLPFIFLNPYNGFSFWDLAIGIFHLSKWHLLSSFLLYLNSWFLQWLHFWNL